MKNKNRKTSYTEKFEIDFSKHFVGISPYLCQKDMYIRPPDTPLDAAWRGYPHPHILTKMSQKIR